MALDVDLLRSSFALVAENEPNITRNFYEILFERNPAVVPMFADVPMERQETMLRDALVAVMEHLEDGDWLTTNLRELGVRHEGYGATPAMYDAVGEALLCAIAEAAGDAWTYQLEQAWEAAYGAIVSLMTTPAPDSPAPKAKPKRKKAASA